MYSSEQVRDILSIILSQSLGSEKAKKAVIELQKLTWEKLFNKDELKEVVEARMKALKGYSNAGGRDPFGQDAITLERVAYDGDHGVIVSSGHIYSEKAIKQWINVQQSLGKSVYCPLGVGVGVMLLKPLQRINGKTDDVECYMIRLPVLKKMFKEWDELTEEIAGRKQAILSLVNTFNETNTTSNVPSGGQAETIEEVVTLFDEFDKNNGLISQHFFKSLSSFTFTFCASLDDPFTWSYDSLKRSSSPVNISTLIQMFTQKIAAEEPTDDVKKQKIYALAALKAMQVVQKTQQAEVSFFLVGRCQFIVDHPHESNESIPFYSALIIEINKDTLEKSWIQVIGLENTEKSTLSFSGIPCSYLNNESLQQFHRTVEEKFKEEIKGNQLSQETNHSTTGFLGSLFNIGQSSSSENQFNCNRLRPPK